MREFVCTCGNTISIVPECAAGGYLIWDADVDRSIESRRVEIRGFLSAIASGKRDAWIRYFYAVETQPADDAGIVEDIISKHDHYTRVCIRCSGCGRVFIEQNPGTNLFRTYVLER